MNQLRLWSQRLSALLLLSTFGLLTLGCATRSEPVEFFALDAISAPAASATNTTGSPLAIEVGPATFPDYLDRPQIVSRTAENRLKVDEFHRWGGSLQEEFLRILGENLGTLLGTSHVLVYPAEVRGRLNFRIPLDVLRFEGVDDRQVLLKVRWALVDPDTEDPILVRGTRIREPAKGPGVADTVAAQSRALGVLSRQIADEIQLLRRKP